MCSQMEGLAEYIHIFSAMFLRITVTCPLEHVFLETVCK